MIWPARLAILAAVACTMWFNAAYALSKAATLADQAALLALAFTIDTCKATFLPAASHLWHQRWRIAALVLLILWPFAFIYSTFAGYAYIATHRSGASLVAESQSDQNARAKAAYDRAAADLEAAKEAPNWKRSAACAAPRRETDVAFCNRVATLQTALSSATNALSEAKPARADIEASLLAAATGLPMGTLDLVLALWPAVLLELIASLGAYAVTVRPARGLSHRRLQQVLAERAAAGSQVVRNASRTAPVKSSAAPTSLAWGAPRA